MSLSIALDRMQYGVGQGGFHCQQIVVETDGSGVEIEPYRFVYDCGADTGPLTKGQLRPLEWAVRHFVQNGRINAARKVRVDTLYLSHFQKDHINGAERLAELADLKEVVIPHVTKQQLTHIVAQQVASGDISTVSTATTRYLRILERAASGEGPVIGAVPTTRLRPGEEQPRPPNNGAAGPPQQPSSGQGTERRVDDVDLRLDVPPKGPYRIRQDVDAGGQWLHRTSRQLHIVASEGGAPLHPAFWELRAWCYAQSAALSDSIMKELEKLEFTPGQKALPMLIRGTVNIEELTWAIAHRVKIQRAYKAALKLHRVANAGNHNVVSLCLHSGPMPSVSFQRLRGDPIDEFPLQVSTYSRKANSWLGTADALLADSGAWTSFRRHFEEGHDRLKEWRTVLMPHHGSGAGGNFNDGLLKRGRFAVFSAGAFNIYRHPSRSILQKVADADAKSVVVTEHSRPGFFEYLTYSSTPPNWGNW